MLVFINILKEEVSTIGDSRFRFDTIEFDKDDTAYFSFGLGLIYESFNLKLNFLKTADKVFMRYTAVKLVERAYGSLIRKIQSDYRRVLVDVVDAIRDVVERSPIVDFEITSVDYRQTTALIKFKVFGFDEEYKVDLVVMETFGSAKYYAEYVMLRVIGYAADTMIHKAQNRL